MRVIFAQSTNTPKITSCVKKNGEITIVNPGTNCGPNETSLEWDKMSSAGSSDTGGTVAAGGGSFPFICFHCDIGNRLNKNLVGRDLRYTLLVDTSLADGYFNDVDFSNATFEKTSVKNVDLRNMNFSIMEDLQMLISVEQLLKMQTLAMQYLLTQTFPVPTLAEHTFQRQI